MSGEVWLPFASRCSWVPPMAVTSGSLGGQVVVGKVKNVDPSSPTLAAPLSPEAARTVTWCRWASTYATRSASTEAWAEKVCSVALKLWLITSPRW